MVEDDCASNGSPTNASDTSAQIAAHCMAEPFRCAADSAFMEKGEKRGLPYARHVESQAVFTCMYWRLWLRGRCVAAQLRHGIDALFGQLHRANVVPEANRARNRFADLFRSLLGNIQIFAYAYDTDGT